MKTPRGLQQKYSLQGSPAKSASALGTIFRAWNGCGSAISRRIASEVCIFFWPSSKTEGAGKTGCALHPRSRVQCARKKCAHEHTGSAGASRPSLRNGFTAYNVLSPVNGFLATVAFEKLRFSGLSASTAASGPHDFAVRVRRVRLARHCVHRISPHVRDDREPPLHRVRRTDSCR